MRIPTNRLGVAAGLGALLLVASCSGSSSTPAPPPPSLAAILEAQGLTTLLTAIGEADLGETLAGPGPFTVFAPTNAAFEALPDGLLTALLADPEALSEVLLYHVVSGQEVDSTTALGLTGATMANGDDTIVDVLGEALFINDARVTEADLQGANGIVHVIDRVLLPPLSIPDALDRAGEFTELLAALDAAGLDGVLGGPGPFTLFAPTDEAFAAVDLSGLAPEDLVDALLYHVISDEITASNALLAEFAQSNEGTLLLIDQVEETLRVNGATITLFNIPAENGVIHVIDAVLGIPGTIANIAGTAGVFDSLVAALDAVNLVPVFDDPDAGPFTVFAPTDDAFAALPEPVTTWLAGILADPGAAAQEDLDLLLSLLQFHVAPTNLTLNGVLAALADEGVTTLLVDNPITVDTLDGVELLTTNVPAANGVIHVVDTVLVFEGFALP